MTTQTDTGVTGLVLALVLTFGTRIATTALPTYEATIIITVALTVLLGLGVKVLAWWLRERRLDRADGIAAARARAAYEHRRRAEHAIATSWRGVA